MPKDWDPDGELRGRALDAGTEARIVELLQALVALFNKGLRVWEAASRCTANFSWKFDSTGRKIFVITEIDRQIYRDEPPSREDIQSALDELGEHDVGPVSP